MDWEFTAHAKERLEERSILTQTQLTELFDTKYSLLLRTEKNSNRENLLIWSTADNSHLVAVIDRKTRSVITVLYPDYFSNCGCVISQDVYDMLHDQITPPRPAPAKMKVVSRPNICVSIKTRRGESISKWINLTFKAAIAEQIKHADTYDDLPSQLRAMYSDVNVLQVSVDNGDIQRYVRD